MIGCSRWHLSVTAVKILKSIAAAVAEYQRKSPLEDPGAHARVKYGRGDDYYEHQEDEDTQTSSTDEEQEYEEDTRKEMKKKKKRRWKRKKMRRRRKKKRKRRNKGRKRIKKKWRRKNKRGVGKIGVMSVASIFQKAVVKLKVRLRGCFNNTKIDKTLRLFIFLITLSSCKIFV